MATWALGLEADAASASLEALHCAAGGVAEIEDEQKDRAL